MDPVSQAVVGAVASQSSQTSQIGRKAALLGALGGMAADLDIIARFLPDPLAIMRYHRHFTHSLAFIPVGALLTILPFLLFKSVRQNFLKAYIATLLGYATHGLLDACTSYGTVLFWPFSETRVAWDSMSIIDPIFTITLLILMLVSLVQKKSNFAIYALVFLFCYIGFGFLQNSRALKAQKVIAAHRSHTITNGRVLPTLGNLIVWRSIYEHDNHFYVDQLRVSFTGDILYKNGSRIQKFSGTKLSSYDNPKLKKDFKLFQWFADDYLGLLSQNQTQIQVGDMRYSLSATSLKPLWGMEILPLSTKNPVRRIDFDRSRDFKNRLSDLWNDIFKPQGMLALPKHAVKNEI